MHLGQIKLPQLQKGKWSIYWLGNHAAKSNATPGDPHFWVQFESDEIDPETLQPRTEACSLPAGFFPAIQVGRYWVDGQGQRAGLSYRSTVVRRKFHINVQPPHRIEHAGSFVSKSDYALGKGFYTPCVVVETPSDTLIIPILELGRFYWGTSTRLMQALVTGQLNSPDNLALREDPTGTFRTGPRDDGGYQIILRRHMYLRDAWPISRLLLDPIARQSVQSIYAALLVDDVHQRTLGSSAPPPSPSRHPRTIFPFEGETTLTVRGIPLASKERQRPKFLVLAIEQCTHPFPVEELYVTREQREYEPDGADTHYPISANTLLADEIDDETRLLKELVYDVPTKQMRPRLMALKEQRFPWLHNKVLHPLGTHWPTSRPMPYVVDLQPIKNVSTGEGSHIPVPTQRLRIHTIESSTTIVDRCVEPEIPANWERHPQFDLIVKAAAALASTPKTRSEQDSTSSDERSEVTRLVTDWHVRLPQDGLTVKHPEQRPVTCWNPTSAPDNWWRLAGTERTRARTCQWVELQTKNNRHIYVLELEPREPGELENATYVLSFKEGAKAGDAALTNYLDRLVRYPADRQTHGMESYGWHRKSVKHMPDSDEWNLGSRLVLAIRKLINLTE